MSIPSIANAYLRVRDRIDALVRPLDEATLATPNPCCPGWTVHGVVSHLVGNVEWAADGRLQGPPSEDETALQVEERAGVPTVDLLDRWAEQAPEFAAGIEAKSMYAAVVDVVTHEHDLRQALGSTEGRDSAEVHGCGTMLLDGWRPPSSVRVTTPLRTIVVGPDDAEPALAWSTDEFEVLRARMGRRSHDQLLAMDWTGDPTAVIASLAVFGPSPHPIEE